MANLTKAELTAKFKEVEEIMDDLDVEIDSLRLNDLDGQPLERDIDSKLFQVGDKIQEAIQLLNEAMNFIK